MIGGCQCSVMAISITACPCGCTPASAMGTHVCQPGVLLHGAALCQTQPFAQSAAGLHDYPLPVHLENTQSLHRVAVSAPSVEYHPTHFWPAQSGLHSQHVLSRSSGNKTCCLSHAFLGFCQLPSPHEGVMPPSTKSLQSSTLSAPLACAALAPARLSMHTSTTTSCILRRFCCSGPGESQEAHQCKQQKKNTRSGLKTRSGLRHRRACLAN